ncbi:MAG TPA: dioxygenase [Acidimicrobiales bacterium]|nr:dioxygenase [Acidimicrobiales bacterium]
MVAESASAPTAQHGDHTDRVVAAFAPGDRLAVVLRAAVRHLHAFVEEVGLTPEEWMAGVRFLTEVGARCDDVRQEFILLSDVLGVSSLVELVNVSDVQGASPATVLGPFYVEDSPAVSQGGTIVFDPTTGGEPLAVTGTVADLAGRPVAGATVDVWQVQPDGRYDIEVDPGRRNLRGRLTTDDAGRFSFHTVRPVDYTIPADGPVGSLLQAAGRHPWRPAHLHVAVTADGYRRLVTHLFDAASAYLDSDAVFAVRDGLVTDLSGPAAHFDFVLAPAPGGPDHRSSGLC